MIRPSANHLSLFSSFVMLSFAPKLHGGDFDWIIIIITMGDRRCFGYCLSNCFQSVSIPRVSSLLIAGCQAKAKVEPRRRFKSLWLFLVHLMMFMFCCFAKLLYYFFLNIHHVCDIIVDGLNFYFQYSTTEHFLEFQQTSLSNSRASF